MELNESFDPDQARAAIRDSTSVPLSFKTGQPAEFAVDRWDDISPFWGGNAITNGSSICTTAFAARTVATNADALVTARHCGTNSD